MELESDKNVFPNLTFKTTSGVIESARRIKSLEEIEKITKAQAHVDYVLLPLLKAQTKEGISEQALKYKLDQALQKEGAFRPSFESIVAFGPSSACPHHISGARPLQKGDNILVDCGVFYEGYASDMTRNFSFGKPSRAFVTDYEDLLAIQEVACKKFIKDVKVADIDQEVRSAMGQKVEFYTHSLGHGVGLEIHESPGVSFRSKAVLQENEIVTCEPGYYRENQYGIRIEDLILVGKNKAKILSQTAKVLLNLDEI